MQLVLYTTEYCQLCEKAQSLIYSECEGFDYELKLIDISDSDEFMARYAIRIPVLAMVGSPVELDWPFDAESLLEYIKKLRLA